jgi:hypothetical protein
MARSCDHDFVALSILPGGLIAWQIPKWVDVPNDRCVGLIPSPKYQIRSGRLHGGHAQTLPPGRRGIRYKVPARWSQPLDVPRASTTAGEIYRPPQWLAGWRGRRDSISLGRRRQPHSRTSGQRRVRRRFPSPAWDRAQTVFRHTQILPGMDRVREAGFETLGVFCSRSSFSSGYAAVSRAGSVWKGRNTDFRVDFQKSPDDRLPYKTMTADEPLTATSSATRPFMTIHSHAISQRIEASN